MIMDFEKNCYHSPLTLENAKENTFLESTFICCELVRSTFAP